jgi:uncharacterized LabA/DUF88 family protein
MPELLPVGLAVTAPAGLFFLATMPDEPPVKRAVAFYDGQNLYRHAKDAFGHHHPNYDPIKLFNAVCASGGWHNHGVRFYTGTPAADKARMWHGYWAKRLLVMRRAGILVTDRPIRYRETEVQLPDGSIRLIATEHEKGIDLRLGLDVVRLARTNQLDVAVIFSQDQDLAEVAREVRDISRSEDRWLKVVSAFPSGPNATVRRGIDGTDWFRMDQAFYDACLDPRDYRPKK